MLIDVKGLSAYYRNNKVFSDVSFSVFKGDYLCITGENGSGKTTLMRLLLGLPIKYTGEIRYEGLKRNKIGWLPQHNESAWDFPANVREVVLSGLGGKRFFGLGYTKSQIERALKNMQLCGVSEWSQRSFRELSGGQKQRVLLCRALCAADSVLLLDEPTASLDGETKEEMYTVIKELNKSGVAIIMITHDIERASLDAKHVLNLKNDGYSYEKINTFAEGGDA
ncbi:MAG: ATP-binding cassette domain-containing protein [Clostridia bacterium]|nr:ATP-binding cassette domain-containing protein [Clostridia bacterium]